VATFAGVDLAHTRSPTLDAASVSDNNAAWLVLGGVAILGAALGVYSMLQDEGGNNTC
jgi:hypothetical protein